MLKFLQSCSVIVKKVNKLSNLCDPFSLWNVFVHVFQFICFKIQNNIFSLIYSSKLCSSTQISTRSPDGTVLVPAVPSKAKRTAGMAVIGAPSQSACPLGEKGTQPDGLALPLSFSSSLKPQVDYVMS